MGASGANPYAGNPLSQNVQSAYTSALGQAGGASGVGADILQQGGQYGGQAGDIYGAMSGYTPQDVTAGQLATTDLSPYMNPYTTDVINATMNRLDQEYGRQRQGIYDEATAQNAFGGDRQQLQEGVLGGSFLDTKAKFLADLYSGNFQNAQAMAGTDIGNRLSADTANANRNAGLYTTAAGGLGNLAQLYGQLGLNQNQFGITNLGNLANMGFGMGNTLQQNQLAAGNLQQQQQQALIDAIHAQALGYANAPQQSLDTYLAAIRAMSGSTGSTTTSSSNPGLLGYLGAGVGALGLFL